MDAQIAFLIELKQLGLHQGILPGLLHILIGRTISRADASVVSNGVTWRELAGMLKKARWPKASVLELGLTLDDLPQRDRQQFWYAAIVRAKVDSPAAAAAGNRLAELLKPHGYHVSAAPGG